MPRPLMPPIVLPDGIAIPLALPPLVTRITFLRTWCDHLTGPDNEAPLAVQHLLTFAALGLCWEAGGTIAPWPGNLASFDYDLLRYGLHVANGLEGHVLAPMQLLGEADRCAGALIDATTTPKPAAVQATADFSQAELAPASSPVSAQPIAGSAPPSPGAT